MKNYYIYIADESGAYTIPVAEKGHVMVFDCIYAAEVYAEKHGLKSGYEIR